MSEKPKPFQSKLLPHLEQIAKLRRTHPPTSYEAIAKILLDEHSLSVSPNAIWSFVKARSKVRKIKYAIAEDFVSTPKTEPPRQDDTKKDDQKLSRRLSTQAKPALTIETIKNQNE
jgi:hypothetical protein